MQTNHSNNVEIHPLRSPPMLSVLHHVKQQKKSSNKWTCVVCNQKQSVMKVYAQGYQAKDIRHFVQSFNMSRKLGDDVPSSGHFVEHLEGNSDGEDRGVKRRSDWSEYVEDDGEVEEPAYLKSKWKEEGAFEPEVVTELPDGGMFKKPKLKGKSGSFSSCGLGDNKVYKQQFSKRNTKERTGNQQVAQEEMTQTQPRFSRVAPIVTEYPANNTDLHRNTGRGWQQKEQQPKHISTLNRGAGKWSEYMDENEEGWFERERTAFADDLELMYRDLEADVTEQGVEEDIHPDFK